MNRRNLKSIKFFKKSIFHVKTHFYQSTSSNALKWPTNEIRKTFLDHFCKNNKHKFIPSSSVIPRKGSGTYFTNAGMNQFKSIILGDINSGDIIDYNKYIGVANSQKCIRIGGKHSDLDSIGKDDNHHTFFEMLGNWSFGKYGKEQACKYALELLIDIYKLDIKRLYFTYFAGNSLFNIPADEETKNIWIKLGVPQENIIPFGMKENFWEMDLTGPCGPCTEIHYDRTNERALNLLNQGDERVIELWNLVFMQYNRLSEKTFIELPELVVDTGMGLERLSAVLNNLNSNYDIDMFTPIFKQIEVNLKDKNISLPSINECSRDSELKYGYRSLSDHIRTISVSISDGLIPTRTGLGGYLKYLILKCFRISRDTFKIQNNQADFLCSLVVPVVNTLKNTYPQLEADSERIKEVIQNTEIKLKSKLKRAEEISERLFKKAKNPGYLSAQEMWRLHKGGGTSEDVPVEFIVDFAKKKSVKIDLEGFDKLFIEDTEKSLKNLKHVRHENTQLIDICSKLKRVYNTQVTRDDFKYNYELDNVNQIARYKEESFKAKILSIIRVIDNKYKFADYIENGDKCIIVLDRSNFYSDKGGQQSDHGVLKFDNNVKINVSNVQSLQDYLFHFGEFEASSEDVRINVNDYCNCEIDGKKRYKTTLSHSGVHVLNDAIRKVYKDEDSIVQVMSSARDYNFKFEFLFNKIKSFSKPSLQDIKNIESECRNTINEAIPVFEGETEYDNIENGTFKIRRLRDIMYPKRVRVVSMGKNRK